MRTFLKVIGVLFALFIVIIAAGAIMLTTLDPNSQKERIATVVKDKTGRDLAISGNIEVTYYPVLGFKAEGVDLSNPEGFDDGNFISVGTVSAGVKVLPLLSRRVEISKVILWDPRINVIRHADGKSNLQFPAEEQETSSAGGRMQDISIESIEIKNGQVNYNDMASGSSYIVDPLNLNLPGYQAGKEMNLSLDMVAKQIDTNNVFSGDFDAKVSANPQSGVYSLKNIQGTIAFSSQGQNVINFSGNVVTNLRTEEITASNFRAGWKETDVQGNVSVKGFSQPVVNFTVAAPMVDFNALSSNKAQARKTGNDTILPVDFLRKLTVDGTISADEVRVMGAKFNNARAEISGKDGIITGNRSITGYGGTDQATIVINVTSAVPAFTVTGKTRDVQAGDLIREIKGEDYITGSLDIDYALTAAGNTVRALKETAGGTVGLEFSDGYINKWQLSSLINQAIGFIKSGQMNPNAPDKIQFTSLKGSFIGSNGVFRNDDLVLLAPESHALGSGRVSLRDMNVDYTVRAGLGSDPAQFREARHLPVRISGPLSGPHYALDVESAATEVIQQELEEKTKGVIDDLMENLGAQEPAAGEEGGAQPAPEDPAQMFKNFLGESD